MVGHVSRPAVLSRSPKASVHIQGGLAVPLLEARRERSGDHPAADRRDDLMASR